MGRPILAVLVFAAACVPFNERLTDLSRPENLLLFFALSGALTPEQTLVFAATAPASTMQVKALRSDGTLDPSISIAIPSAGNPFALAMDSSGHVYVGGTTGSLPNRDWFIKKFGPDGVEIVAGWNKSLNLGADDMLAKLLVAPDGSVYAIGGVNATNEDLSTNGDGRIKKFLSDGTEVVAGWDKTINSVASSYDIFLDGFLDAAGNVHVFGTRYGNAGPTATNNAWWYLRYAPDGSQLQEIIVPPGAGGFHNRGSALVQDANGDFVFAGRRNNGGGDNMTWQVMRYNSGGGLVWSGLPIDHLGTGGAATLEQPFDVTLSGGAVYVGGQGRINYPPDDYYRGFIHKIDGATGAEITAGWPQVITPGAGIAAFDSIRALLPDGAGGIYAGGSLGGVRIYRFDAAGNTLFNYGGGGGQVHAMIFKP